ncbi:hypothetical protein [Leucobacter luti]|nr:hypothetical protein [Leucobacter luti]
MPTLGDASPDPDGPVQVLVGLSEPPMVVREAGKAPVAGVTFHASDTPAIRQKGEYPKGKSKRGQNGDPHEE